MDELDKLLFDLQTNSNIYTNASPRSDRLYLELEPTKTNKNIDTPVLPSKISFSVPEVVTTMKNQERKKQNTGNCANFNIDNEMELLLESLEGLVNDPFLSGMSNPKPQKPVLPKTFTKRQLSSTQPVSETLPINTFTSKDLSSNTEIEITPDTPICHACNSHIAQSDRSILAFEKHWHIEHFQCQGLRVPKRLESKRAAGLPLSTQDKLVCGKMLLNVAFVEKDGCVYCEECYQEAFNPRCAFCKEPIKDVSI
ncbi:Transforming growth factor beta-1-induced transcript 1 protein [Nowakowskiella sp. JEL0078]|nr:Transforming growth factor beta-1-induced transcript 1 protein [Nowakowskiella sp. JEL0078]